MPSDHTVVLADLDIPAMEKHALVNIESNLVKNEISRNFCESRTFALANVILCEPHCLPAQTNRGNSNSFLQAKIKEACEAKS